LSYGSLAEAREKRPLDMLLKAADANQSSVSLPLFKGMLLIEIVTNDA
jgi:hypothetical protein